MLRVRCHWPYSMKSKSSETSRNYHDRCHLRDKTGNNKAIYRCFVPISLSSYEPFIKPGRKYQNRQSDLDRWQKIPFKWPLIQIIKKFINMNQQVNKSVVDLEVRDLAWGRRFKDGIPIKIPEKIKPFYVACFVNICEHNN